MFHFNPDSLNPSTSDTLFPVARVPLHSPIYFLGRERAARARGRRAGDSTVRIAHLKAAEHHRRLAAWSSCRGASVEIQTKVCIATIEVRPDAGAEKIEEAAGAKLRVLGLVSMAAGLVIAGFGGLNFVASVLQQALA